MWFETLVRGETSCASYMFGSQETGECAIFDPLWDIRPYLNVARRKGAQFRYVIDSHSHADHVSGARRLAAATGAELVLPERAEIEYEATRVGDGDELRLGEVRVSVLHVPGHRPEQINLLLADLGRGEDPWCLLTADFLFVGDVARSDLALDGIAGARDIFDRALPRVEDLPDFVEVYPGHFAGST
ncbi:MAG: MBL fold metallo-hydrolase [Gemmatimonadota bacterium]